MDYNNLRYLSTFSLLILLALAILAAAKTNQHQAKIIEEVDSFNLNPEADKYHMRFQVAHHNFALMIRVSACRTWIKQGLCKACDKEGESCSNTTSCFASANDPKISCDTAFCSRNGDYSNSESGIYGEETQIFCTVGGSEKVLMPFVLATKISEPTKLMGEFCLLDSDSSFKQGLLVKKQKKISIINTKVKPEQSKQMRDFSFSTQQLPLSDDQFLFGKGTLIKVTNPDLQKFRQIVVPQTNGFQLQFSLDQIALTVPTAYLRQLQKELILTYFAGNSCRFISGKIKCRDQLQFGAITQSILKFEFTNNFVLSLPLHLLFSSCAAKECRFLLSSHNKSNVITMGTLIWQTLALQWDMGSRKLWIHRLNNHWAAPYKQDKLDFNHKSFLSNMLTFLYHIFLNVFYLLLGLGLASILINFLVKWPEVLRYLRGILMRVRRRKQLQVEQTEREDDYFVGGLFQERERGGRRLHRLPEELQDQ